MATRRVVDVEVRYVDGCPHVRTVEQRLAMALVAAAHSDVRIRLRVVENDGDAVLLGFTGSPTILVEGSDPFGDDDAPVGLSCRLYPTPDGMAGSPTIDQLIGALTNPRGHKWARRKKPAGAVRRGALWGAKTTILPLRRTCCRNVAPRRTFPHLAAPPWPAAVDRRKEQGWRSRISVGSAGGG